MNAQTPSTELTIPENDPQEFTIAVNHYDVAGLKSIEDVRNVRRQLYGFIKQAELKGYHYSVTTDPRAREFNFYCFWKPSALSVDGEEKQS